MVVCSKTTVFTVLLGALGIRRGVGQVGLYADTDLGDEFLMRVSGAMVCAGHTLGQGLPHQGVQSEWEPTAPLQHMFPCWSSSNQNQPPCSIHSQTRCK